MLHTWSIEGWTGWVVKLFNRFTIEVENCATCAWSSGRLEIEMLARNLCLESRRHDHCQLTKLRHCWSRAGWFALCRKSISVNCGSGSGLEVESPLPLHSCASSQGRGGLRPPLDGTGYICDHTRAYSLGDHVSATPKPVIPPKSRPTPN